eukprot:m.193131 g.193131  ORF g.193131 m.193131 type:complete len:93 (+) comp18620_c0_seq7:348-626(+)
MLRLRLATRIPDPVSLDHDFEIDMRVVTERARWTPRTKKDGGQVIKFSVLDGHSLAPLPGNALQFKTEPAKPIVSSKSTHTAYKEKMHGAKG